MKGIGYGFRRGFEDVIEGFLISVFVNALSMIPFFEPYRWVFAFINIAGYLGLIAAMPRWSTSYLVGWILSIIVLSGSELMSGWDLILNIIAIIIAIAIKARNLIEDLGIDISQYVGV
jgi:hypothetical protein